MLWIDSWGSAESSRDSIDWLQKKVSGLPAEILQPAKQNKVILKTKEFARYEGFPWEVLPFLKRATLGSPIFFKYDPENDVVLCRKADGHPALKIDLGEPLEHTARALLYPIQGAQEIPHAKLAKVREDEAEEEEAPSDETLEASEDAPDASEAPIVDLELSGKT